MPTLRVLAVFDRAVEAYGTPIFTPAVGVAVRSFSDECNRPESQFFSHPEDYSLVHLADFDDASGFFAVLDKPRTVAVGKDVKRPVQ